MKKKNKKKRIQIVKFELFQLDTIMIVRTCHEPEW